MWHCPHCGAPQAETARCWVCHRSSTTCSTCRHFRASLVSDVGYCALDRARRPLTGRELRGCWTQPPAAAEANGVAPKETTADVTRRAPLPVRGFVPLDELLPAPIEGWETRSSLFGELDR